MNEQILVNVRCGTHRARTADGHMAKEERRVFLYHDNWQNADVMLLTKSSHFQMFLRQFHA